MRWEDERWIKVYTRNLPEWRMLSLQARGLFVLLMREVDRAGILPLGKRHMRAIAVAVDASEDEVKEPIDELIADGCIRIDGDRLVIPNFVQAQEAVTSDAEKQRRRREAVAAKKTSYDVADTTIESPDVTGSHPESPDVTTRQDETRETRQTRSDARARGDMSAKARDMFGRLGILAPDAQATREACQHLEEYAKASGEEPGALCERAEVAFRSVLSEWAIKGYPTPQTFCKHWDKVQAAMAGTASKPRPQPLKALEPQRPKIPDWKPRRASGES